MLIHIKRNAEVFGPYSIEEAREYLSAGRLSLSDFAQLPGTTEWIPLASVPGVKNDPPPLPPDSPVSETQVPTDVDSNKASEMTPRNQLSPWKRASKRAENAFGFGFFIGVVSGYRTLTDFTSFGRILFAGCIGLFIGLATYFVAVLYFVAKGVPKAADEASASKARKTNFGIWAGIIALFIMWLVSYWKESKMAQENPNSSAESQVEKPNNAADAETQAAAQFEKDFYEKYPDLKPYGKVCDAVALKVKESGYRGESREAVMETLAKAAREEVGRQQQAQHNFRAVYSPEQVQAVKAKAEAGDAGCQWILGGFYLAGQGVPQDRAEAVKWLNKAAEQGLVAAQEQLAEIYYNGSVVERNYAEAEKWFRKAAEQDFSTAQFNLASMYAHGIGVPQNFAEACKWSYRAAAQGEAEAQGMLGLFYEVGWGVQPDRVEAYKWLNLAVAGGMTNFVKLRDELMVTLYPEQLAEGQRRAAAFVPHSSHILENQAGLTNQ